MFPDRGVLIISLSTYQLRPDCVEALALTDMGINLAIDLTAVTEVTVELACGRSVEELSLTNAVKSELWA